MAFMDMQETALPADDTAMQLELKRRLKMAEALQQQAMPEGQMVSGHYVAPSWTQYLANAVNKYQGGKQEREALGQFGQYQTAKQDKITKLVNELSKGKTEPVDYNEAGNMPGMEQTTPFNQQEYMAKVLQTMPELAPKFLEANLTNQFKEETPLVVGNNLVSKTGKVLYAAPEKSQKLFGTVNPSDFTPKSLATYAQSGNYGDLELIPKAPTGQSNIAKLTAEMNSLPPNDPARAMYLAAIRKETYIAPREDNQPLVAVLDANGQPTYVPRNQAVGKTPYNQNQSKPSEFESKAQLYSNSMKQASQTLNDLESKKGTKILPNYGEIAVDESTGLGRVAVANMRNEDRKSYVQAQKQWIDSINRVRSGASMPELEYGRAVSTFFPELNDSPERIKQKNLARQQEEASMQAAAGKAAQSNQSQSAPKIDGVYNPKTGKIE